MSMARCMISDMPAVYDAQEFADLLTSAFKNSFYKSWQEVADKVESTRSTLSRYAGAKPQTLTGKPSQPEPELVIKLARLFDQNVNQWLQAAGHAALRNGQPEKPHNVAEFVARLEEMGFDFYGFDQDEAAELGPDDLQDLMEDIEAKILSKTRRRKREAVTK
jgi:hypothetical protein